MRRFFVSLVILSVAASAAYAQQQSAAPAKGGAAPDKSAASGKSAGSASDSDSPDSASGGERGLYGPPDSAAGHLRGVYGPSRPAAAKALSSRLSGSANSSRDSIPSLSIPGTVRDGQSLPEGVQASPMSDRPGYGRARINGRLAIVDLNGNRIVQFLDSPGQLGGIYSPASGQLNGVYGAQTPAQTPSSTPLSSTLSGSINSSTAYGPYTPGYAPGATLPAGAQTTPSPYGATGYGQAWINGSMVTYDRSTNRIVNVQNLR